MVAKKNINKALTTSQQKIIDILQQEVIGRYFDAAEIDNEFELLSTLRYDPNFTHLFRDISEKSQVITLDEIDFRLRGENFDNALENAGNGNEDSNARFNEFFGELTTSSSFDNESTSSLMSLLDNICDDFDSSPPASLPSTEHQQAQTDLLPTFFGRFLLLGEHYKRLNFALQFFKWEFHVPLNLLLEKLIEAIPEHHEVCNLEEKMKLLVREEKCYKMRVLISKSGRMRIEAHPLPPAIMPLHVLSTSQYFVNAILSGFLPDSLPAWDVFIDTKPTCVSPFTTFKTTYRNHYNESRKRLEEMATAFGTTGKKEVLLYNDANQLMEGSITNVAVIKEREDTNDQVRFITPSLASGCLCGTMRYYLLKKHLIYEQPIDVRDLTEGDTVILFNGVMGAVKGIIKQALK